MKITNSKNETYKFENEEVLEILAWAFGYMDLYEKRFLPIDMDENMENITLRKKLRQCMEGDLKIIEKTRKYI